MTEMPNCRTEDKFWMFNFSMGKHLYGKRKVSNDISFDIMARALLMDGAYVSVQFTSPPQVLYPGK
jgi:hypothetical protein